MTYFVGNDLTQYLYLKHIMIGIFIILELSEASIDNSSIVDDVLKYVTIKL